MSIHFVFVLLDLLITAFFHLCEQTPFGVCKMAGKKLCHC